MTIKAYRLENLDVYRQAINVCTRMYYHTGVSEEKDTDHQINVKIRELALTIVMSLSSGLGFWDKMIKEHHFAVCKQAILATMPLLDILWEGRSDYTVRDHIKEELHELATTVNKLYILAKKRRHEDGEE